MINSSEILHRFLPLSLRSIEDAGDILQYLIPWAALLFVALQGDRASAWAWLYAGSITTAATHLLKLVFNLTPWGRRPNGAGESFPSGHTASAFMGAGFFHFHLGWVWAILPYLLAGFTAYSRVQAGKHWPRDVVGGAFLAIVIAIIFRP